MTDVQRETVRRAAQIVAAAVGFGLSAWLTDPFQSSGLGTSLWANFFAWAWVGVLATLAAYIPLYWLLRPYLRAPDKPPASD